jgi:hypothetical protein
MTTSLERHALPLTLRLECAPAAGAVVEYKPLTGWKQGISIEGN